MHFPPDTCDRSVIVAGTRRARPAWLLTLLGLWVAATLGATLGGAAGSAFPGAGGLQTAASVATDLALLHSGQRRSGLQTLQPSCKGPDGSDSDASAYPTTAAWPGAGRRDTLAPPSRPLAHGGIRRPLQGAPQSPRAPPRLA
jgi:hypothetical protein